MVRAHWVSLTLVCLCGLVVWPIASRPGWPMNHDFYALFERVEGFRREFGAGHVFPLWTPFCMNGHGAPVPFLYHRLFNTVAGALALVFGTVRGTELALVVSLSVGALGMSACARELGLAPAWRLWAGALLPLAHYTFVNWLVRGAAAELTGGMLSTWLIYVCIRMQAGRTFGVRLGVVLILLFYAHIVIFLYATLLIAIATLFTLFTKRPDARRLRRGVFKGIGGALALVLTFAGPYAAAIALIGREFSLHRLEVFLPQTQIEPITHYAIDPFAWGETWRGFSVEIGRFVLLGLGLSLVLTPPLCARFRERTFLFLASALGAYFALQTPQAATFYLAVPQAQIIQFPWRLMVFITPLCILLLALTTHGLVQRGGARAFAAGVILVGALASQLDLARHAYRADYEWYTEVDLARQLDALDGPYSGGEFVPMGLPHGALPARAPFVRHEGCTLVASSVDLEALERVPFGSVDLTFASERGCTVHLSQFRTVLIAVRARDGGRVVRAFDGTTDVILAPGRASVHIARRSLFGALWRAVRRELAS